MRKTEFANGEYYHIFNRGVDKREIFSCQKDYTRFLEGMREFNREESIGSLFHLNLRRLKLKPPGGSSLSHRVASAGRPLVSIICYCLNPNHYHFILRQEVEYGISKFMHKLAMGYVHYFNKKSDRSGALFQGKFKAVHIASNEKLLLLSVYVNTNHFIHGCSNQDPTSSSNSRSDLESNFWPYASLPDYLGKRSGTLCDKVPILGQFKNIPEYAKFIEDNAMYLKEKKELKKYIIE
jgi:putative transposase